MFTFVIQIRPDTFGLLFQHSSAARSRAARQRTRIILPVEAQELIIIIFYLFSRGCGVYFPYPAPSPVAGEMFEYLIPRCEVRAAVAIV